ncbi:hypothetical protein [Natrinema pellirubrum]|nr:hypothetical protein [Natrinema pellirubrum]
MGGLPIAWGIEIRTLPTEFADAFQGAVQEDTDYDRERRRRERADD